MKKADQVLRTLADLYDFHKKLSRFRIVERGRINESLRPTPKRRDEDRGSRVSRFDPS
jgi:hypothetical protein